MSESEDRRLWRITLYVIAALTLIRIAVLILTPLQLYPDEAQYWWWAQTPDFGYFSKPPLIAWIIGVTTAIFGNGEWAIRIASPLHPCRHGADAVRHRQAAGGRPARPLERARLSRRLPGVAYSSGLISTDVPLLFFWSVALYAFLRAMDETGWRWPLICGVAIGYGLLAKYAMLYFVDRRGRWRRWSRPRRARLVFSLRGLAILVARPCSAGAQHRLECGARLSDRRPHRIQCRLEPRPLQPRRRAGLLRQPVRRLRTGADGRASSSRLWRLARGPNGAEADLVLAAFALPPILLMTVQGFISEANANWAATAYVSATPLAVAVLLATRAALGAVGLLRH